MPLAFHSDRPEKYRQQRLTTERHILPFIEAVRPVERTRVLEIGCGEGGVLQPFLDRGCHCVGVDISPSKIEHARDLVERNASVEFIVADVYEMAEETRFQHAFDLIVLKDTIEHVYHQDRLLALLPRFLAPGGVVFIAFPPWRMPYGGHQQITSTKLGKLPYYHLLPRPVYRRLLQLFGEHEAQIEALMEIHDTQLTIGKLERLLKSGGYRTLRRRFYLLNPIYEYKFGLRPIEQLPLLKSVPILRDFITTTSYYLVQPSAAAEA